MFEDLKDKIREHSEKCKDASEVTALSPQITKKIKQRGITVENFTLKDLFPEVLDKDGTTDLSLMSGSEFEVMVTYAILRKYLLEKYPQSQQEAKMLGQVWDEPPEDPLQINVTKAREDSKAKFFFKTLLQMKTIYDKIDVLQTQASEYEKICLRFYWHLTYNWNHAPNLQLFRETFRNQEIFEIVEAYFKICKKYHQPIFEEPYYFLEGERRREVKLEGDMLKRTTDFSDNEIRISILEGIP